MSAVPVLVTQLEYDKAQTLFTHPPYDNLRCLPAPSEESALAAAVRKYQARHVILGTELYTGPLYEALLTGGILARLGVGIDGINLDTATSHGLICTNTPGVLDNSVAEHTIALILAAFRQLHILIPDVKSSNWPLKLGHDLAGSRLALIGCGAIGCRVAEIASRGFNMRVIGCKRAPCDESLMRSAHGFEAIVYEFADAVAGADIISLHMPLNSQTHHFLNAQRLAQIPSDAWLINTSRGGLVDEAALYNALAGNRLGGAALDVFEKEPYLPNAPGMDLRALPNVIQTPHAASSTHEAVQRAARQCLQSIEQAERGVYTQMNVLNPDVLAQL